MTTPPPQPVGVTARRIVFLPHWHDNPYQELLADGLERLGASVEFVGRRLLFLHAVVAHGRPDVVHLHAPDHFVVYRRTFPAAVVALVLFVVQLVLLRGAGVKLVWTVHDLANHERCRPRIDRLCRWLTARLSAAVVVHCEAARVEVSRAYGINADQIDVVPHGHYQTTYPAFDGDAEAARRAIEIPGGPLVMLFFGHLRRHKGLEALIEAYRALDRDDTLLVIAGEPFDAGMGSDVAALVAGVDRVLLRASRVPDAQVAAWFRAADLVVCPFTSSLTSGSLALALSFGKAVIASRQGCAAEMVTPAGGFLYDASQPQGLLWALRDAVDARHRLEAIGAANQVRMRRHDWDTVARQTLAIYEGVTIE